MGEIYTPDDTSQLDYSSFGMMMVGRRWIIGSEYRYGFNGKESDDEIAGNDNALDFGARIYNSQLARFLSTDPRSGEYPWQSEYAYYSNSPISIIDINGKGGPDGPNKDYRASRITELADFARKQHIAAQFHLKMFPFAVTIINKSLRPTKANIKASIPKDPNHNDLTWFHLTGIWLYELGEFENNTISFGKDAFTTKSLQTQKSIIEARASAIAQIKAGKKVLEGYKWEYDQKEFDEGMKDNNIATSFLGWHKVEMSIVAYTGDSYTIRFVVNNTSSWESATRLRKDNDKSGEHDSVIDNKERGEGIKLGGNIKQNWTWEEIITITK